MMHRLITAVRSHQLGSNASSKGKEKVNLTPESQETFIDDRPISSLIGPESPEGEPARPAEEDERTMLDVASIPDVLRAARNCTLCLEEREQIVVQQNVAIFFVGVVLLDGGEKRFVIVSCQMRILDKGFPEGRMPTVPTVSQPRPPVAHL